MLSIGQKIWVAIALLLSVKRAVLAVIVEIVQLMRIHQENRLGRQSIQYVSAAVAAAQVVRLKTYPLLYNMLV
jgi:hypothetical protein